jgi:hypothetical protein
MSVMGQIKAGIILALLSIGITACAVDSRDDQAQASGDSQQAIADQESSVSSLASSADLQVHNPFDTLKSAPEAAAATCALELVQPCIADVAICAVRCCDDSLFKSVQACGNCGTWATGACINHGTRKRIRWELP